MYFELERDLWKSIRQRMAPVTSDLRYVRAELHPILSRNISGMVSARNALWKLTHEPLFVTNDELGQIFSLRQCYNWTMPRPENPAAIYYMRTFLIPADDLEDILQVAEWEISGRHHPETSIWLEAIYKKRTKEDHNPIMHIRYIGMSTKGTATF
jgi:hypothetical protein